MHAGLCCAALLARYGFKVTVCESHYVLGGAAHGFQVKGHHFDAGPSFFAGLSGNFGHISPFYLACLSQVNLTDLACCQATLGHTS